MKKDLLIIGGLFLLVIVLLFVGNGLNIFLRGTAPAAVQNTKVKIGILEIDAQVAKTATTRNLGLSERESLAPNSGVLFVFDKEDRYGFWMKNVKFPLDIIWIDKDKKIADITHSVQPQPGVPDNLLRIYQPSTPVLYVLEIPAGTARFHNFKIGDLVDFSI